jgi:adenosylmethionine-8-amino-7-oxononanoate aminotransferase
MTAIELVSDRAQKTPIDKATIGQIQRVAYEAGAMVRVSGPNIILSPPLVLQDTDAETILSALDAGFASVS